MNTPLEDAVDIVYDILKSRMPGAVADAPHADLAALGVKTVVKNQPGAPYENYINIRYGSFREQNAAGILTITVLIDIASQEEMTGPNSRLARFTERVQKVYLLLRSSGKNRPYHIGEINSSEPQQAPGDGQPIFQTNLSVPVTLGGGI